MATINEVKLDIDKRIKSITSGKSKLLSQITSSLLTITRDRIFTKGIKANGSPIGTYKASTIEQKKKAGRFTSNKINLRSTEDLFNSYQQGTDGKDSVLGFIEVNRKTLAGNPSSTTNQEVRENLENKFGDIFSLTNDESKQVDKIIDGFVSKIFP